MPTPSYRSSRRWTETEARAALTALDASGLSPGAFAAREGLDPQRLRAWRHKLGTAIAPAAFIEVRAPAGERVEVVLRSGVVLRVTETVDPEAVRRLVDALESC